MSYGQERAFLCEGGCNRMIMVLTSYQCEGKTVCRGCYESLRYAGATQRNDYRSALELVKGRLDAMADSFAFHAKPMSTYERDCLIEARAIIDRTLEGKP